jgi:signal transduction histidine kinase
MEGRDGLGLSGEAYLVGPDSLLRTDSRFFDSPTHFRIKCTTPPVAKALGGQTGIGYAPDYRGVPVLSGYAPVQLGTQRWALLAEIDEAEVMQPVGEYVKLGAICLLAVAVLVLGLAFAVSRPLTRSIRVLVAQIRSLALGQPVQPTPPTRSDELGDIQHSIQALAQNTLYTADLAKQIGEGNFSAEFRPRSPQDTLGIALLEMRDKLARYTELLSDKNAQLQALSAQQLNNQIEQDKVRTLSLIEGQESERRRISQELHDGVGQMLTAIKIHLGMATDSPEALEQAKALVEQTKDEIRNISNNLMPSVLLDFGLHAALKLLAKNTSIHSGLPLQLQYALSPEERFLPEVEITLYRIAQEAVNNAIKYARATRLSISVLRTPRHLILRVCDNGIGLKSTQQRKSEKSGGLGLGTMKQRASLLGGRLDVATSLARGTRITVRIPREAV